MKAYEEKMIMPILTLPLKIRTDYLSKGSSLHYHRELEFLYVLNGNLRIQIRNNILDFNEGELAIVKSNEVHSTKFSENITSKLIVLQLDPYFIMNNNSIPE